MGIASAKLGSALLVVIASFLSSQARAQDSWQKTEAAAATASKQGHYAEAEKLSSTNLKYAETLTAKDARLPRNLFDLAEIDRAEGKYQDAFPLYERALHIYLRLYGPEATEIADTLDGEAELYKSLNDYSHAEPLLLRALAMRQKLLHADDPDISQSENDLGELYSLTGAFDKAEPLLLESLASRKIKPGPESESVAQSLETLGTFYL